MNSCYSKIVLKIKLSVTKVQMRSRCGVCVTKSCESLRLQYSFLTSKSNSEVFLDVACIKDTGKHCDVKIRQCSIKVGAHKCATLGR